MSQGHLPFDFDGVLANRDWKSTTFEGKMSRPVHRWFRLTASFSPALVDDLVDLLRVDSDSLVLDPFAGVGTTSLCLCRRGLPSVSIELNPFLHYVASTKTRCYNWAEFQAATEDFEEHLRVCSAEEAQMGHRNYLNKYRDAIPRISNVHRWWSEETLARLVNFKRAASNVHDPELRDLILLAIHSILIEVSNAGPGRVSLSFQADPRPADPNIALANALHRFGQDIRTTDYNGWGACAVVRADSRELAIPELPAQDVTHVITSPPYPNRFSYVRETRPHLFYQDLISGAAETGRLACASIGGTWGRATSNLAAHVPIAEAQLRDIVDPYADAIDEKKKPMGNYVRRYYDDMWHHAQSLSSVVRYGAKLAYVIGNSQFYGVPLPADEVLGAVFKLAGFRLRDIIRMRRRGSKKDLYEATVLMEFAPS